MPYELHKGPRHHLGRLLAERLRSAKLRQGLPSIKLPVGGNRKSLRFCLRSLFSLRLSLRRIFLLFRLHLLCLLLGRDRILLTFFLVLRVVLVLDELHLGIELHVGRSCECSHGPYLSSG